MCLGSFTPYAYVIEDKEFVSISKHFFLSDFLLAIEYSMANRSYAR